MTARNLQISSTLAQQSVRDDDSLIVLSLKYEYGKSNDNNNNNMMIT